MCVCVLVGVSVCVRERDRQIKPKCLKCYVAIASYDT